MIKKYLDNIRNAGLFLLIITFVISTLWGSQHAFFPMLFAVVLLVIVAVYKALHWKEYEKDNKRNAWIALALFVLLFMDTFFPL
jgi:putative effector of murein hydrolase